jgi:hypothetical protein
MGAKPRRQPGLLAWHFLPADRRLRHGDGRVVEAGQVLSVPDLDRPLDLCSYGMHASICALDALQYAPGPIVCRVELSGEILRDDDKVCAQHRRVLWMADATGALRAFARACALDVIDHWDAPDIVRRYLETGDESIRAAAWAAAWAAARAAARDAAWAAARAAARDAAADAAGAAAWAAAGAAAGAAQRQRLAGMLGALEPSQ